MDIKARETKTILSRMRELRASQYRTGTHSPKGLIAQKELNVLQEEMERRLLW